MTALPIIEELLLQEVADRGVPGRERIVLKPRAILDLAQYAVLLGFQGPVRGYVAPIRDAFFWFGSAVVQPADWVFLYTGAGTPSRMRLTDNSGDALFFYWGHPVTTFHNNQILAALVRFGGIHVESSLAALPAPQ